jgi:hypothetical protein
VSIVSDIIRLLSEPVAPQRRFRPDFLVESLRRPGTPVPLSFEPFWPFVSAGVGSATVAPSALAAAAASAGVVCAKPWAEPAFVTFFAVPVWAGWFFFCWTGF